MVGVRGAGAAFLLAYLEVVFLKDVMKRLWPHRALAKLLVVSPQLAPAYAGLQRRILIYSTESLHRPV